MVNRPFMVGPQSLLSRTNSSRPAIGEMETGRREGGVGGGAPQAGGREGGGVFGGPYFFLPPLSPSLLSLQCSAGQGGGAIVRDSNNTKTFSGMTCEPTVERGQIKHATRLR